jgi:hypothetical protein
MRFRLRSVFAVIVLALASAPAANAGMLPLLKRVDTGDTQDLVHADALSLSGTVDPSVKPWFRDRFQALVLHDGSDWATSWIPRGWHQNAWVYRKAVAFSTDTRVPAALPSLFAKVNGTGHLAAVRWGCTTGGCPQPLLDLSNPTARNLWLYGAPTAPGGGPGTIRTSRPTSAPTNCSDFYNHQYDGALYLLACRYKGLWLDDVLADLASSSDFGSASHVADATTGAPLANGELASRLSVSQANWQAGLLTMLRTLRTDIAAMRSAGIVPSAQGRVAINYKWSSFGFAEAGRTGASPTISATSIGGQILQSTDLVELEGGFIDAGLKPGGVSTSWSFERYRQFVRQVHALGRHVLQEKVDSAGNPFFGGATPGNFTDDVSCRRAAQAQGSAQTQAHFVTAQYNLAAALLDWAQGDAIGDMCEVYRRGWDGYRVQLGTPTSGPYQWNGVWRRDFTGGIVLVDPPGGPQVTVTLPRAMRRWPTTPSNTMITSTTVPLQAGIGAINLY